MPVEVACRCGQRFRAIDELAGQRVPCPACGQPLAIPMADARSATDADNLMALGDFSRLEQAAASTVNPLARPGDDLRGPQLTSSRRQPVQDEGIDRWVIVLMCIAGVLAAVVLLVIVLSPLFKGSGEAASPSGGSAAEQAQVEKGPGADATGAAPSPSATAPQHPLPPPAAQPAPLGKPAAATAPTPPQSSPGTPPSTPVPAGETSIQLSAGTALPQSLPTGTAMGFSVDYEFVKGQPDGSAEYVWVIQSAPGRMVKQQVRLKRQGTLECFVLEFQPEHGPFQTSIEDAQGTRLSKSLALR